MDDQSELFISVETHYFVENNEWKLEKLDETGPAWVPVEESDLTTNIHLYEESVCLDPDSTYKWTLVDTAGRGMCEYVSCGEFSLSLNGGEEFFASDYEYPGTWEYQTSVIFETPSDPTGSVSLLSEGPSDSPSVPPSASSHPSAGPSDSAAPSGSPTEYDCDGDRLVIKVVTDRYPSETSWVLELKDAITGEYSTTAENGLTRLYATYVDVFCLESGRSYRWTLTDTYGDGMSCEGYYDPGPGLCGTYSLTLNGEEIVSTGVFEYEVVKEIGPVECVDEPGFLTADFPNESSPSRGTCKAVRRGIKLNGRSEANSGAFGCGIDLTDGSGIVADRCKELCAPYGVGPCGTAAP